MSRETRFLAGLDVGSFNVIAIVGQVTDDDGLDIVGIGIADAKGIRRGAIVDLDDAVASIEQAIAEAELTAGIKIDAVHLGLSSAHVAAFNSRGVVAVASADHRITPDDVRRAITAAEAVTLPLGREFLHVLPQEFVVDDQGGIRAPVGMIGSRLEANVHVITTSILPTQNMIACVHRAGVSVVDVVLDQLAAGEAVLTPDEKDLGVALVDIGSGTTDYAIFERGALWHTAALAMGGDHFTNAIALGLRTPPSAAEKVKRRHGWAIPTVIDEQEVIEVPSLGGRPARQLPQRLLCEVLQPRAHELFQVLHDEVGWAGFGRSLNAGLVLTGGGAILGALPQVAEQVFAVPVRRGCPTGVGGLYASVNSPTFATAVGLVMYAFRHPWPMHLASSTNGPFARMAGRVRQLLFRDASSIRQRAAVR